MIAQDRCRDDSKGLLSVLVWDKKRCEGKRKVFVVSLSCWGGNRRAKLGGMVG